MVPHLEHTYLNKSDNKDSFACKALIGQSLKNCSRDCVVEHKCPNLKLSAKLLIKSKQRVKEMDSQQVSGNIFHLSNIQAKIAI